MFQHSATRLSNSTTVLVLCLLGFSESGSMPEIRAWAAPEIIVFYGSQLESSIVFPDVAENHRFLGSTKRTFRIGDLDDTRPISVALFWGMQWRPYARNPNSWSSLAPARASQHALFYPSSASSEAVLMITGSPGPRSLHIVEPEGLRILSARGVPVATPR